MRQGFVDQNTADVRRRIVHARRAANDRARPPIQGIVRVGIEIGVHRHERKTRAIRGRRPRRACVIVHRKDRRAGGVHERHGFSAVGQVIRVNAIHPDTRILVRERRRITHEHDELTRRHERADRKDVTDAIRETHATEFEICAGDVFQLDELERVAVKARRARRIIHDFGDEEAREILDDVKRGFRHRAPDPAAERARLDVRALRERDRPAVNQRAR